MPFLSRGGLSSPRRVKSRRPDRTRWVWLVAAMLVALATTAYVLTRPSGSAHPEGGATLLVESVPSGATIQVDGQTHGRTPASLGLAPGEHRVKIRHERYLDATYPITLRRGETATLRAELWLRTPSVQRVHPAFPGATIAHALFLDDGRLALTIALPAGDERHLWVIDGDGGTQHIGPPGTAGSIAVAPDGEQVAYLAHSEAADLTSSRPTEVWVAPSSGGRGERHYALSDDLAGEHLVDLSWSPDGRSLLLVSERLLPSGGRGTRLLRLEMSDGEPRELASLPSEIVPGSYSWSPNGEWVAFLVPTDQLTALCLLGTSDGAFHYLADIGQNGTRPLAISPVAWSPDGRLFYVAPDHKPSVPSGWLFGAKPSAALFAVDLSRPVPQSIGEAAGDAPTWWNDGTLIVLARTQGDDPLVLRVHEPGGEERDLIELPIRSGTAVSALWDMDHAQALFIVQSSAGFGASQPEYWLVRFREAGQ